MSFVIADVCILNDAVLFIDMLQVVISAGTQNRQYTHQELDVIVDSARLFDRCSMTSYGPTDV